MKIKPIAKINKIIKVPPDKSISHRAVIISSLARGKTLIKPFLRSDDTRATIDCLKKLGVGVKFLGKISVLIRGTGLYFPKKKKVTLNAGESGTTMRILTGILCAQKFAVDFKAAAALNKRPMGRVVWPLTKMNANFMNRSQRAKDIYPPLLIRPSKRIKAGKFKLKIASAQVKSALIFASLYADKITTIKEPYRSRDHTERMLKLFKAPIAIKKGVIHSKSAANLKSPRKIFIPSDFSSAAFFIVLGLILKNSKLTIKDVNINPSRAGLLRVLKRMGAKIKIINKKNNYEPYADIEVKSSKLKAVEVKPSEIPAMIDEIPILCVAACFAKGKTTVWGVKELKVKETDRIKAIKTNLKAAGGKVSAGTCGGRTSSSRDWFISVRGPAKFKSAKFLSFSDHRTAMSAIILGVASGKSSIIDDTTCINKSFPEFKSLLKSLY